MEREKVQRFKLNICAHKSWLMRNTAVGLALAAVIAHVWGLLRAPGTRCRMRPVKSILYSSAAAPLARHRHLENSCDGCFDPPLSRSACIQIAGHWCSLSCT